MRQLIAVLVALVLSACSYDPYHYYYNCIRENGRYIDPIYIHNNVLKWGDHEYRLVSESDNYLNFASRSNNGSSLQIVKGTNRINNGIVTTWETFNCTLEKTLIKK